MEGISTAEKLPKFIRSYISFPPNGYNIKMPEEITKRIEMRSFFKQILEKGLVIFEIDESSNY
jgi:hypothetical protein